MMKAWGLQISQTGPGHVPPLTGTNLQNNPFPRLTIEIRVLSPPPTLASSVNKHPPWQPGCDDSVWRVLQWENLSGFTPSQVLLSVKSQQEQDRLKLQTDLSFHILLEHSEHWTRFDELPDGVNYNKTFYKKSSKSENTATASSSSWRLSGEMWLNHLPSLLHTVFEPAKAAASLVNLQENKIILDLYESQKMSENKIN